MMSEQVRWGILSTAGIAAKNWQAMRLAENATLVAVASRDGAKAAKFIDDCQSHVSFPQRPRALGSYEALLADDAIDAVYIPLPTGLRKEWVIRAAQAGKHVLCEKPCAVSTADLQQMVDACRENNVQFMDGVMYMHGTRLEKLREAINDGESIGKLKRIASQFSFLAPEEFFTENIRSSAATEPAGCLGDLGWYTIRLSLFAVNYKMPRAVRGCMLDSLGSEAVPMEFSGEMFWDNGVSASFYCSFKTENQQWANFSGTAGNIQLNDFVQPFFGSKSDFEISQPEFEVTGCDFNMKDRSRTVRVFDYASGGVNSQETNMIRNFSHQILSGGLNDDWPAIALRTQRVLDACLESARNDSKLVEIQSSYSST